MSLKTLDTKLTDIHSNSDSKAFILAYAADSDMGGGILAPGQAYPPRRDRPGLDSMQDYYEGLTAIVEQGKLDILLASVSTMDVLAREKKLFENSAMTPAIRANDATDIWGPRGSNYKNKPSRPHATTTIEEAQYGTLHPSPNQQPSVNLGLYSVTFNNDLEADWFSLERFKEFRVEATRKNFRYFLEIFNPNVSGLAPEDIPHFVNDHIVRMLAGVPRPSRPEFLKIPYNGPAAMEELVNYDSTLVVGVLGGGSSTHYDTMKLLADSKKHGAHVALFGRRIKGAEHPLTFLTFLREVADDNISPAEAVKAYHGELQKLDIQPHRDLDADMEVTIPEIM